MNDHKQPWWNNGDAVSGLAATVVVLMLLVLLLAVVVRVAVWIWP